MHIHVAQAVRLRVVFEVVALRGQPCGQRERQCIDYYRVTWKMHG